MTDKVVISNRSALIAKYGAAGEKSIRAAIRKLVSADHDRGLDTTYVEFDDAATMKKLGGRAVTNVRSGEQNKDAVDAVYKALAPDYILLLGAVDVIPHQRLSNPAFDAGDPDGDTDRFVPSDLPYACEAPFANAIEKFTAPTRVVGRLPDLTGASDPAYLIDVLKTAASARPRPRSSYEKYFAISASPWKKSTALSLEAIFGTAGDEHVCPPELPPWSSKLLSRRSHFINCHGAPRSSEFSGQRGQEFPTSYQAAALPDQLSEGVIAAMECCYGAELYDPAKVQNQPGIANTYLGNKAYGYLGSTTTSFGPARSNGWADLLCQYFFESVLEGASCGRALLEARQKYVQNAETPLDPFDLKTLAQFVLLGDPAVQPVQSTEIIHAALLTHRAARIQRRKDLIATGRALEYSCPAVKSKHAPPRRGATRKRLEKVAKQFGMKAPSMMTFQAPAMRTITSAQPKALRSKQADVTAVHVLLERRPSPKKAAGIRYMIAVVIREAAGQIISIQEGFAK